MEDIVGAALVALSVATALMPTMATARAMAAVTNIALMAYAAQLDLHPILLLNAVMLPINILQTMRYSRRCRSRINRYAAFRRRSTISAHQEQPAGIASSLKS